MIKVLAEAVVSLEGSTSGEAAVKLIHVAVGQIQFFLGVGLRVSLSLWLLS